MLKLSNGVLSLILLLRTAGAHVARFRARSTEIEAGAVDMAIAELSKPPIQTSVPVWSNCTGDIKKYEDAGPVYSGEDLRKMIDIGTLHDPVCAVRASHEAEAAKRHGRARRSVGAMKYSFYLKAGRDGYCRMNEKTTCSLATRMNDYAVYAIAGARNAMEKQVCLDGYEAGAFKTAPGVNVYDAKMCFDNGFLDDPHVPWYNFHKMTEIAASRCKWLKTKFKSWDNWTYDGHKELQAVQLRMMSKEAHLPFKHRGSKRPTRTEMMANAATSCAMYAPHGLACDMAYCLYNYCMLDDGRVGMGKQCRGKWMSESYINNHIPSQNELDKLVKSLGQASKPGKRPAKTKSM